MNTVSKTLFLTSLAVITLGLTITAGKPPTSDKPTEIRSAGKELSGKASEENDSRISDSEPLIERPPTFNGGGLETFRTWFGRNLLYPQFAYENGIQGNVTATFVIKSDGSLSDITILSSPNEILSQEVIRVLSCSPQWTPAINTKGEPIEILYHFPVNFRCQ